MRYVYRKLTASFVSDIGKGVTTKSIWIRLVALIRGLLCGSLPHSRNSFVAMSCRWVSGPEQDPRYKTFGRASSQGDQVELLDPKWLEKK